MYIPALSRSKFRRASVSCAVFFACMQPVQAHALGVLPWLPNWVTWITHLVGGAIIQHLADEFERNDKDGITASAVIGVVKEIRDPIFDPVDAIMWPIGAATYRAFKNLNGKTADKADSSILDSTSEPRDDPANLSAATGEPRRPDGLGH